LWTTFYWLIQIPPINTSSNFPPFLDFAMMSEESKLFEEAFDKNMRELVTKWWNPVFHKEFPITKREVFHSNKSVGIKDIENLKKECLEKIGM